jgi:hypothetical protein
MKIFRTFVDSKRGSILDYSYSYCLCHLDAVFGIISLIEAIMDAS